MKKTIVTFLLACCFGLAATAQTPDPAEMERQMREMENRLREMEARLRDMQHTIPAPPAPPGSVVPPASPGRPARVIIIDGQRIDSDSFELDLEGMESLRIDGDSLVLADGMRIYQKNDSLVVRIGALKVKVDEDGSKVERAPAVDLKKRRKTIETTSLGLRLGLNNYLYDGKFKTPPGYGPLELRTGKSVHVNLGLAGVKWKMAHKYATLHTGLALDFLNYRYDHTNMLLVPRVDSVMFHSLSDNPNISKYKLTATYLEVPLRVQFQTNKKDSRAFRVSMGGRVAYRIGSHTKVVANHDKIKQRDDFNLTTLKYGLTGQVRFSYLNFYVNYDLTPVFEAGVHPRLTPVAAGIVLTGW